MTAATAHVDTFCRENLPPRGEWPDFRFDLPELRYPERLNAAVELLDRQVEQGDGARRCLVAPGIAWSYAELQERVNRIANVLVSRLGFVPGNRVLIRSPNSPMMVAIYLAVLKAGGVVVATMPLLRAKELAYIVEKARVTIAICEVRLASDLVEARRRAPGLARVVYFGGDSPDGLEALMEGASPSFDALDTSADDVCLIGFTSGTTGQPKGAMHVHRDLLATCDTYGRHVLQAGPDDLFIGSPPIAFTFGLGGLVLFPLRIGAAVVLVEQPSPARLLEAIEQFRATVCFTAPTAYRAMLSMLHDRDIGSLRKCVSAGEVLPKSVWEAWHEKTGLKLLDGIGATEMLHIFIAAPEDRVKAGSTGLPVPGYEARIVDEEGNELPAGEPGKLAVRGPTGCRYLNDPRQRQYVRDGWNITGDTYVRDAEGYFWFKARADDMIVSAGYNIAGPEVEDVLLAHPAVAECGVVGAPDADRGEVVAAYVVLRPGVPRSLATAKSLQEHVKAEISPYKYPRSVVFVDSLPRTQTGKLQRYLLREMARSHQSGQGESAA